MIKGQTKTTEGYAIPYLWDLNYVIWTFTP